MRMASLVRGEAGRFGMGGQVKTEATLVVRVCKSGQQARKGAIQAEWTGGGGRRGDWR